MTDLFPDGTPFSVSERASSSARLERAYRRLVAFYPWSFRLENAEEIIAVLLATAREDQRRPSATEAADLLRGALRARFGLSRCPRTVLNAVRLMYLGALTEIALIATVLATSGSIQAAGRAAAIRALAAQHDSQAVTQQALAQVSTLITAEITADVVVAVIAMAIWLILAWANGKGYAVARVGALISCLFCSLGVAAGLSKGDATYAPAAVAVSCSVLAIGVAATVLLLVKRSWPYFDPGPTAAPAAAR